MCPTQVSTSQLNRLVKEGKALVESNKIHFISFAGGPFYTFLARKRMLRELRNCKIFSSFKVYQPRDLGNFQPNILGKVTEIFRTSPRGFGYWLWKPGIIREKLNFIADGDYLLYADVGCEILNYSESDRILDEMARTKILMVWSPNSPNGFGVKTFGAEEKKWSKKNLIMYLELNEAQKNSRQLGATWILLRKSELTLEFVDRWLALCLMENQRFLTDSVSQMEEDLEFIEHRHDQSVFSCLVKTYETLYLSETEINVIGEKVEENWIQPRRNFSVFSSKTNSRIITFVNLLSEKAKYLEIRLMKSKFWRKFLLSLWPNHS